MSFDHCLHSSLKNMFQECHMSAHRVLIPTFATLNSDFSQISKNRSCRVTNTCITVYFVNDSPQAGSYNLNGTKNTKKKSLFSRKKKSVFYFCVVAHCSIRLSIGRSEHICQSLCDFGM